MAGKKTTPKNNVKIKSKKKKEPIIEPLFADVNRKTGLTEELIQASYVVINQFEFDQIIIPIDQATLIFSEELYKLMPELQESDSFARTNKKKFKQNYQKALYQTTKRILTKELIEDIQDILSEIEERLESEPDDFLEESIFLISEFLEETEDVTELASLPLFPELILQHFKLLEDFYKDAEKRLGQPFDDIIQQGPNNEEAFEALIDEYENEYPGFYDSAFGEQTSEEDEKVVINKGILAILHNELKLNLFTKKELEKGTELADDFFNRLSAKDKKALESMNDKFSKKDDFIYDVLGYIKKFATQDRLNRIKKKLESYLHKNEYEQWYPFIDLLKEIIQNGDSGQIVPLLAAFYYAQLRTSIKIKTKPSYNIFWYD